MLARVDHIDTGSENGHGVGPRLCGDAQGASVRRAVNTQSHARDNGQAAFGGGGGEAVGIAQTLCAGVSAADDRERWGGRQQTAAALSEQQRRRITDVHELRWIVGLAQRDDEPCLSLR